MLAPADNKLSSTTSGDRVAADSPATTTLSQVEDDSYGNDLAPPRPSFFGANTNNSLRSLPSTVGSGVSSFFASSANSSATNLSVHDSATDVNVQTNAVPDDVLNGKIVISLCGGGVRGITGILFLKALEEELKRSGLDIRDCVDLIGGTSTGGISALMFGRLALPLDQLVDDYENLTKSLFGHTIAPKFGMVVKGSKHSSKRQREVYSKVVRDAFHGDANVKLREDVFAEDCDVNAGRFSSNVARIPVFVVAVDADGLGVPTVISSCGRNAENDGTSDITIVDAAIATSAAPFYFKPLLHGGRRYIDGGIGFNNPTEITRRQLQDIYGRRAFADVLISVGTGHKTPMCINLQKNGIAPILMSAIGFTRALVSIATGSEATHQRVTFDFSSENSKGSYFRFNPEGLEDIHLDDYAAVPRAKAVMNAYLNSPEQLARVVST